MGDGAHKEFMGSDPRHKIDWGTVLG